jgi:hypothetical protein
MKSMKILSISKPSHRSSPRGFTRGKLVCQSAKPRRTLRAAEARLACTTAYPRKGRTYRVCAFVDLLNFVVQMKGCSWPSPSRCKLAQVDGTPISAPALMLQPVDWLFFVHRFEPQNIEQGKPRLPWLNLAAIAAVFRIATNFECRRKEASTRRQLTSSFCGSLFDIRHSIRFLGCGRRPRHVFCG